MECHLAARNQTHRLSRDLQEGERHQNRHASRRNCSLMSLGTHAYLRSRGYLQGKFHALVFRCSRYLLGSLSAFFETQLIQVEDKNRSQAAPLRYQRYLMLNIHPVISRKYCFVRRKIPRNNMHKGKQRQESIGFFWLKICCKSPYRI